MVISNLLNERGMTIYQLSEQSGVPYSTVKDICNGITDIRGCKVETIYHIAKTFNVNMDDLLSSVFSDRNNEEIIIIATRIIEEKAKELNIKRVTVFGSRANGKYRNDSDLDLFIEFSKPISLIKKENLRRTISEAIGVDVDIVTAPLKEDSLMEITEEVQIYG